MYQRGTHGEVVQVYYLSACSVQCARGLPQTFCHQLELQKETLGRQQCLHFANSEAAKPALIETSPRPPVADSHLTCNASNEVHRRESQYNCACSVLSLLGKSSRRASVPELHFVETMDTNEDVNASWPSEEPAASFLLVEVV